MTVYHMIQYHMCIVNHAVERSKDDAARVAPEVFVVVLAAFGGRRAKQRAAIEMIHGSINPWLTNIVDTICN